MDVNHLYSTNGQTSTARCTLQSVKIICNLLFLFIFLILRQNPASAGPIPDHFQAASSANYASSCKLLLIRNRFLMVAALLISSRAKYSPEANNSDAAQLYAAFQDFENAKDIREMAVLAAEKVEAINVA